MTSEEHARRNRMLIVYAVFEFLSVFVIGFAAAMVVAPPGQPLWFEVWVKNVDIAPGIVGIAGAFIGYMGRYLRRHRTRELAGDEAMALAAIRGTSASGAAITEEQDRLFRSIVSWRTFRNRSAWTGFLLIMGFLGCAAAGAFYAAYWGLTNNEPVWQWSGLIIGVLIVLSMIRGYLERPPSLARFDMSL